MSRSTTKNLKGEAAGLPPGYHKRTCGLSSTASPSHLYNLRHSRTRTKTTPSGGTREPFGGQAHNGAGGCVQGISEASLQFCFTQQWVWTSLYVAAFSTAHVRGVQRYALVEGGGWGACGGRRLPRDSRPGTPGQVGDFSVRPALGRARLGEILRGLLPMIQISRHRDLVGEELERDGRGG